MVRPTLEYASNVWDPYKQKDAQLLERYIVEQQSTLTTASETGHWYGTIAARQVTWYRTIAAWQSEMEQS